jgi:hypothetical protein
MKGNNMRKLGELLGKTTAGTKELVKTSVTGSKKVASVTKTAVKDAKTDFVAGFKATSNVPVAPNADVTDIIEVTE